MVPAPLVNVILSMSVNALAYNQLKIVIAAGPVPTVWDDAVGRVQSNTNLDLLKFITLLGSSNCVITVEPNWMAGAWPWPIGTTLKYLYEPYAADRLELSTSPENLILASVDDF